MFLLDGSLDAMETVLSYESALGTLEDYESLAMDEVVEQFM